MKEKEPIIRMNILDLLVLVINWRKLFIVNFVVVVVIAVVVALGMPKWYVATVVILPVSRGGGGIPSFLPRELRGVAVNFGLELPSEDIYQSILGSRTLKENIIERFNLRVVYNMGEGAYPEDLLDAFSSHYMIETLADQSIAVTVEDRDPELTAAIANACVEELDRIYSKITSETARDNRIFIGGRLQEVNDSLDALQKAIMLFQQQSNAVSITEQVEATISIAANLKAKLLSNQVKLEVMRSSLGNDHPAVAQLLIENRKLEEKHLNVLSGDEGGLFLSLRQLPELSRRYAELVRQVRVQRGLLEFVYPQYESARIQEDRETANVQVLDKARVPYKKSRPKRKVIVIISAAASLLVTLVMVLLIEYWNSLPSSNREDWAKIQKIISMFRRR